AVLRFRVSLSGGSNLTRFFFRSVSGLDSVSGGRWGPFAFRLIRLYQKFLSRISAPLPGTVSGT
ncbi:hypothetical protein, partial [Streptomyces sp. SP18CS02]|uniref:hypothetical protein n=1 Tax=Streptomyces sp. SP18CS02 TaxID=3002531 RepID=UPI002E771157